MAANTAAPPSVLAPFVSHTPKPSHNSLLTLLGPLIQPASTTLSPGTYTLISPDDPQPPLPSDKNPQILTIPMPSSSQIRIGTHTLSVLSCATVVDHMSFAKNGLGTTTDDICFSVGDSGLVVATSTDASNISNAEGALAAFIMSGFGWVGEKTPAEGTILMASTVGADNGRSILPFDSAAPKAFYLGCSMSVILMIFWTFLI